MIRLLLIDDQELIKLGLRTLFDGRNDIELVAELNDCEGVEAACRQAAPDIILLDIELQSGRILGNIPDILKLCPYLLVLTANKDRATHLQALKAGAKGIVTKDQNPDIILKAVRAVVQGEAWINRNLAADLLNMSAKAYLKGSPPVTETGMAAENQFKLTEREIRIVSLAVRGLSAKKIAARLLVSDKTIRNQLVAIYSKLGVSSRVELVVQAPRLGLKLMENED